MKKLHFLFIICFLLGFNAYARPGWVTYTENEIFDYEESIHPVSSHKEYTVDIYCTDENPTPNVMINQTIPVMLDKEEVSKYTVKSSSIISNNNIFTILRGFFDDEFLNNPIFNINFYINTEADCNLTRGVINSIYSRSENKNVDIIKENLSIQILNQVNNHLIEQQKEELISLVRDLK